PSFLHGVDYCFPAGSTRFTLRRYGLGLSYRGPAFPLYGGDWSACGCTHRPSFRSSRPMSVYRSLGTPRTAMTELRLNLCNSSLYLELFTFVAEQCSAKKTVVVSCHAVEYLRPM